MKQDLFPYIPPEIIINILTRLPFRTIMRCKCVCKSWLDLVESPEFAKSHLSKSVPGLAAFQGPTWSKPYKIFEFVDDLGPEHPAHRCNIVFNFSFPQHEQIHSSVNGLLFFCNLEGRPNHLFICNPITGDYIMLPCPLDFSSPIDTNTTVTFGFGVSKISGQYKLVRIFRQFSGLDPSKCEVYTLGTGSWRSIAAGHRLQYELNDAGAFLNGNLHWLAFGMEVCPRISCFDLEKELFSTFSSPPIRDHHLCFWRLSALGDCLCLCDNSIADEIVIWLMKEYGDGKSWTKELVISCGDFWGFYFPIKIFRDGDILIAKEGSAKLSCYSNKTKIIQPADLFGVYGCDHTNPVIYTPSFLSLKTFMVENVHSSNFCDLVHC